MSEHSRFLLTVDSATGAAVKVERVGEAGELTEVDLQSLLRMLGASPAAAPPQQIIINVYGGGGQGPATVAVVDPSKGVAKPQPMYSNDITSRPYKPKKDDAPE